MLFRSRDVFRADGRTCGQLRADYAPAASVYQKSDFGDTDCRSEDGEGKQADYAGRRCTESVKPAVRMPVPDKVSVCGCGMRRKDTRMERGGGRAFCGMPPHRQVQLALSDKQLQRFAAEFIKNFTGGTLL